MINLFKHLLPRSRAWNITSGKRLRQLFQGLTVIPDGVVEDADKVFEDLNPETTTFLKQWEEQFGLPFNVDDEPLRRSRLSVAWESIDGGQSVSYLQSTLQAYGFNVYVFDWWEDSTPPIPGTQVDPLVRDPFALIDAQDGYWLTNKLSYSALRYFTTCGNPQATCGNPDATCGNITSIESTDPTANTPVNQLFWPRLVYVAADDLTPAQVPLERRDEFEDLLLQKFPLDVWVGVIVEYV